MSERNDGVVSEVANLASRVIGRVLRRAVDIVVVAEKAFRDGLNPKVEDAKVLREWDEDSS